MNQRTAQCSCGRLTVTCTSEPVSVALCHCLACQRRTGSTYGIAAFFEEPCVVTAGDTSRFTRSSDSGHSITFHFCPTCGSTVFWRPERMPGRVAVAVGAFGDPSFPAPAKSVHHEHRHFWVEPSK
jgi:hypothetical protein